MDKLYLGILITGLGLTVAHAQQPEPSVSIIIEAKDHDNIRTYLDQMPYKYAAPLVKFFDIMQTKAKKDLADKTEQKKKELGTP